MGNKVVFVGCSFTAGNGWADLPAEESRGIECKDSPHLWVNICHQTLPQIKNLELVNVGQVGASNTEILQNAVRLISSIGAEIDIMFCQWTSAPRYNFNVGFELWDTSESLRDTDARKHDINLNKGDHWPREYVKDLLDRLRVMHHLHWEIVKIIDYSATLSRLAKQIGFDIFFINGLCPWDNDYFTKLENVKPESYTDFTKKQILNIDSRDDQTIFKLYDLAHDHYQQAGGINHKQWINLYDSFIKNKIDTNFDLSHPGKKSNILYYNLVKEKLQAINN
jgi:hypothetical protein